MALLLSRVAAPFLPWNGCLYRCRESAEEIARRVEYIELTTRPRFVEEYTAALMLP